MLLVLSAAVACRQQWPNRRELSRKIMHIGTGPVVLLAWWRAIPASIAIPVAVVVTVITAANHRWRVLPESVLKEEQVAISLWRNTDQNENQATQQHSPKKGY